MKLRTRRSTAPTAEPELRPRRSIGRTGYDPGAECPCAICGVGCPVPDNAFTAELVDEVLVNDGTGRPRMERTYGTRMVVNTGSTDPAIVWVTVPTGFGNPREQLVLYSRCPACLDRRADPASEVRLAAAFLLDVEPAALDGPETEQALAPLAWRAHARPDAVAVTPWSHLTPRQWAELQALPTRIAARRLAESGPIPCPSAADAARTLDLPEATLVDHGCLACGIRQCRIPDPVEEPRWPGEPVRLRHRPAWRPTSWLLATWTVGHLCAGCSAPLEGDTLTGTADLADAVLGPLLRMPEHLTLDPAPELFVHRVLGARRADQPEPRGAAVGWRWLRDKDGHLRRPQEIATNPADDRLAQFQAVEEPDPGPTIEEITEQAAEATIARMIANGWTPPAPKHRFRIRREQGRWTGG